MADGIFTDEELAADVVTGAEAPPAEGGETPEQKADRERDGQGRFKAKEGEDGEGAAPVGDDGKKGDGTVPQGALHAERERRKAAEQETAKLREQFAAIAKMRDQVAARKPEDLPPADDPAAIEHLRARLAEVETATTRVSQSMDDAALNNHELQQLGGFMQQSEARYRAEKPDYDEAINHVVNARARELSLYGLNGPQIQQAIAQEATEIVRSAVAQGRDPAELGYQIALSRGYQPKASGGEQQQEPPSAAQRTLDAIEAAKRQGKSLGGTGGGKVQTLNAEAILALTPEEFDALYSTPDGKRMIDAL